MLQSLVPNDLWLRTNGAQPEPEYESRSTDEFSLFNGATGEVLKTLPTGGMRRFSRAKLRRLITEGIEVKYGKTLSPISYPSSCRQVRSGPCALKRTNHIDFSVTYIQLEYRKSV